MDGRQQAPGRAVVLPSETLTATALLQIERGKHLDVLANRPRGSWVNNLYHGTHTYSTRVLKVGELVGGWMVG